MDLLKRHSGIVWHPRRFAGLLRGKDARRSENAYHSKHWSLLEVYLDIYLEHRHCDGSCEGHALMIGTFTTSHATASRPYLLRLLIKSLSSSSSSERGRKPKESRIKYEAARSEGDYRRKVLLARIMRDRGEGRGVRG